MINKSYRINKKEFDSIIKNGFSCNSSFFSLKFLENKEKISKFSVVVSKKVTKSAIFRNKTRRRVYSILKNEQKNLKKQGFFMFFAKKDLVKKDFSVIKADILYILSKIK